MAGEGVLHDDHAARPLFRRQGRQRLGRGRSDAAQGELAIEAAARQPGLSRKSEIGKATAYALNHWTALTRFLEDGRICLSNNAAERALRGVAVGRKNGTFAGSDRGGARAAAIHTLVETAELNGIDPQARLADVPTRIADHPAKRIDELLPWNRGAMPHAAA